MTGCAIVGGYIAILVMGNWLRNGKWRGTITMRGVLRLGKRRYERLFMVL